ncbi:glycine cleavage system protein GcvH [Streptomyces sp. NPDC127049]|uniref:glycine cleavage system protein GcvH n=1 Tax=unclassified Streptomyces TaxID=2593676 RepID=UPI00366A408F
MATTPAELKYTKDHEWVRVDGETVLVGLTHYAQKQLGDIVFVELPETGRKLDAGDPFGTVESVKSVSEVYAPVAGEVTERNTELDESPELINDEPYDAWLVRIRISGGKLPGGLLSAAQYDAYVADDES